MTPTKLKRAGREDFCPGDSQPERKYKNNWDQECYNEGWWEASGDYDREQVEQERLSKIGYDWEDPEEDIIASIKQIQEILNQQLKDNS